MYSLKMCLVFLSCFIILVLLQPNPSVAYVERVVKENIDRLEGRLKVDHGRTQDMFYELLAGGSICGNMETWGLYDNRKCVLVSKEEVDWERAETLCRNIGTASMTVELLMIDSKEELNWMTTFLKGKIHNSVYQTFWLRNKRTDGSSLNEFRNLNETHNFWDIGMPLNRTGYDCVQFTGAGKYNVVPCTAKARPVCQKESVSIVNLLDVIARKSPDLPPLGYLYTQYSGQRKPEDLWPNSSWEHLPASPSNNGTDTTWKRIN